jgi:hypothetical protein
VRDALEATARRIADLGRHALSERLRAAVEHTAATHASVVELTSGQLDQIVGDAADRADGRLWRRTLARAGSQELGIGLAAAFDHPAGGVARRRTCSSAPSVERRALSCRGSRRKSCGRTSRRCSPGRTMVGARMNQHKEASRRCKKSDQKVGNWHRRTLAIGRTRV